MMTRDYIQNHLFAAMGRYERVSPTERAMIDEEFKARLAAETRVVMEKRHMLTGRHHRKRAASIEEYIERVIYHA